MAEHSTVARSAVRPSEPARQVIATFDNYADAERAVDYLSDQRFEVNQVAIVGRELEYLEQVLGRLNYGGAALRGAGSGALVGALIGWIFGLFNWIESLISALVFGRLRPGLRRHRGRLVRAARVCAAARPTRFPLR